LQPLTPRAIGVDSSGNLYIGESGSASQSGDLRKGSVLRSTAGLPRLLSRAVVNAANLLPSPVAPGELVTLFGTDLGPAAGVSAQPDASGRFATNLAGVRVLFDGVPAPVFYAQAYRIHAVVPSSATPGATVEVRVEYNGRQSAAATIEIAEAAPSLFTVDAPSPRSGRAAALNQDGTVNSPGNPAENGSIVTLYATGAGVMQPAIPDGQIVTSTESKPVLPVSVRIGAAPAEVLYAGPAPGMVAGILQINVRVPGIYCPTGLCYFEYRDPNAIPVSLGMGQSGASGYKYSNSIYPMIAVKAIF
jgi:uncharacterized protein (TIGR03437 family)